MDSDLYFSLDRPHITCVDRGVFRSLLGLKLKEEKEKEEGGPRVKRQKKGPSGGETVDLVGDERSGIVLFKQTLELGILLPFEGEDDLNLFESIDESFKSDWIVNIVKTDEDPSRFLVYLPENTFGAAEKKAAAKKSPKKKLSAAAKQLIKPPFLLELQITKNSSLIANEVSLLRQIGKASPRTNKIGELFKTVDAPTLTLEVDKIDRKSGEITFKGHIKYSLVIFNSAQFVAPHLVQSPIMRQIFAYLLDDDTFLQQSSKDLPQSVDAPLFYNIISSKDKSKNSAPIENFEVKGLKPTLFRYQKETVQWLLRREGKDVVETDEGIKIIDLDSELRDYVISPPPGWCELTLPSKQQDQDLWANPYIGCVCSEDVLRDTIAKETTSQYYGRGLLAEEMGLGKTVELIALLSLNERKDIVKPASNSKNLIYDYSLARTVMKAKTTLVISPTSILDQWVDELKKHAPSLNVCVYKGKCKGTPSQSRVDENAPTAKELAQYDVVITTYRIISREIYYAFYRASTPEKEYMQSPLVQLQFWRVILDEVQMVSSGVSKAANVARIIPRVHAWAVTGTPVKKDMSDLQGILIFLRMEPFAGWNKMWAQLLSSPRDFEQVFSKLSIRHTRSMLEDEDLRIPPQRRILLSIPFTPIEENNYQHLYGDMLRECNVSEQGKLTETIDLAKLSTWLMRLRQACCHARIGMGNRKALGGGPLRTINDVLDAMYEQSTTALLTDEKRYYTLYLERGQLLEKENKPKEALDLWNEAMDGVSVIVDQLRKEEQETLKLREEREKEIILLREQTRLERKKERLKLLDSIDRETTITSTPFSESDFEEDEEDDVDDLENEFDVRGKARLRSWVELLHRCYFFVASGHFQMYHEPGDDGGDDDQRVLTEEETNHQTLERKYYDLAELLRRELLQEPTQKVKSLTEKLNSRVIVQQFVSLEDATIDGKKMAVGLESRNLLSSINALGENLNRQADLIDEWREELIKLLGKGLLDGDTDPDGEEYNESLDAQEFAFSYLEILQQVLSDRTEALTGTPDPTIMEKVILEDGVQKSGFQEDLEKQRNAARPVAPVDGNIPGQDNLEFSMAGYLAQVKNLPSSLTGTRGSMEILMLRDIRSKLQKVYIEQRKELKNLIKETSFFSDLYNARVEYYRQLQEISDNVVAIISEGKEKEKETRDKLRKKERECVALKKVINQQSGRQRYLTSLRSLKVQPVQAKGEIPPDDEADKLCIICQCTFYIGSLTICGHQFCRDCLQEWWKSNQSCPVCKRIIGADEVYNFSYRRQDVEMQHVTEDEPEEGSPNMSNGIYSLAAKKSISEIRSMELSNNYGSKIDFIVQHLLWLRSTDKSTQVVIFSQWSEMLDLLKLALDDHYIEYATVTSRMDEFKKDSQIACFLLHAKAESAGLNLINATHVYLCEPLVNTPLELQAISRIHRIGQTKATKVWLFTICGTVEDSIFKLSTEKRLKFLLEEQKITEQRTGVISEQALAPSNSHELEQTTGKMLDNKSNSGGEVVGPEDLLKVLFPPEET